MKPYGAHQTTGQRTARLWIIETLIVLGVVAFGYFALTLDQTRWGSPGAPAEDFDPIAELTR